MVIYRCYDPLFLPPIIHCFPLQAALATTPSLARNQTEVYGWLHRRHMKRRAAVASAIGTETATTERGSRLRARYPATKQRGPPKSADNCLATRALASSPWVASPRLAMVDKPAAVAACHLPC